jgi:hypothetical protein
LGLQVLLTFVSCVAAVCVSVAGDDPSPSIPDGSVEFAGHRYLLVDDVDELSWELSDEQCVDWGGTLAVVSSTEESQFIAELCDGRYMYLGATDRGEEGVWEWVDGTPWDYTNWLDGQPNDYGGAENFLATYDGGKWVDVAGSGSGFWMPTGFICEWAP